MIQSKSINQTDRSQKQLLNHATRKISRSQVYKKWVSNNTSNALYTSSNLKLQHSSTVQITIKLQRNEKTQTTRDREKVSPPGFYSKRKQNIGTITKPERQIINNKYVYQKNEPKRKKKSSLGPETLLGSASNPKRNHKKRTTIEELEDRHQPNTKFTKTRRIKRKNKKRVPKKTHKY